jgi:hypothetical protein
MIGSDAKENGVISGPWEKVMEEEDEVMEEVPWSR